MAKSQSKTAAEFAAELEKDLEYQKRLAESQAVGAAQGAAAVEDERQLIAELGAAGVSVASVYDFIGKSVPPTPVEAAPVLVKHLSLPHIRVVREGIIRALSCNHLRSQAVEALKAGYMGTADARERWLFANALAAMASLDELRPHLDGVQEYAGLFKGASQG